MPKDKPYKFSIAMISRRINSGGFSRQGLRQLLSEFFAGSRSCWNLTPALARGRNRKYKNKPCLIASSRSVAPVIYIYIYTLYFYMQYNDKNIRIMGN